MAEIAAVIDGELRLAADRRKSQAAALRQRLPAEQGAMVIGVVGEDHFHQPL